MSTIDHKTLAEDALEIAVVTTNSTFATERLAFAQVHAALYAAEQQERTADELRIGNLLAFTDSVWAAVRAGDKPSDLVWARLESAGKRIIEGLGL